MCLIDGCNLRATHNATSQNFSFGDNPIATRVERVLGGRLEYDNGWIVEPNNFLPRYCFTHAKAVAIAGGNTSLVTSRVAARSLAGDIEVDVHDPLAFVTKKGTPRQRRNSAQMWETIRRRRR